MKLMFRAKMVDGLIKRPELTNKHVVNGGPFNPLTFKMALRRLYNQHPELRLPMLISISAGLRDCRSWISCGRHYRL